jgi:hypothetical protein
VACVTLSSITHAPQRDLRERRSRIRVLAEILLRWLQRPRAKERVGGIDLDSMSECELEKLYAGPVRPATLDDTVLAALVDHVLAGDELGPS